MGDFPCIYCNHSKIEHSNWDKSCLPCNQIFTNAVSEINYLNKMTLAQKKAFCSTFSNDHVYSPDNLRYLERLDKENVK